MTDTYVLRNMVEAEQADFAALLRGLTPEQWDTPSLCRGWSVHDTAIHAAQHAHTTNAWQLNESLHGRFSPQAQMEPERTRPTDELVEWLASPAKLAGRFDILTQLSELIIHQQDVRRPLGIDRQIPADRLSIVLDFGVARSGLTFTMAFSRRRARGLRLVAPDIGWWAGTGPEVRGPGEAILMALNGRAAAIRDLSGNGTAVLAARIKSYSALTIDRASNGATENTTAASANRTYAPNSE
jgi:uncharacterized protein (TIGR03083 family)